MARRLRIEPYDPDAVDGDGDGIVQENTAWERPFGTRLLDEFGNEIRRGIMSTQRPARMQVIDRDGNAVRYTPSYAGRAERPTPQTSLGQVGFPSLAEQGAEPLPTLEDMGIPTVAGQSSTIDERVNRQTIVGPAQEDRIIPEPSMFPSLEPSQPVVDHTGVRDPIFFGGPMMILSTRGTDEYKALDEAWVDSHLPFFNYHSGLDQVNRGDISFDEFRDLAIRLSEGRSLTEAVVISPDVISEEQLADAVRETLALQIDRTPGLREAMKARAAKSVADHMTRAPLEGKVLDEATDYISDKLAIRSGLANSNAYFGGTYVNGASRIFPMQAFPDGTVALDNAKIDSLIKWGLGGPEPLWLSSPDTPDEYKIIFGAGVTLTRRDFQSTTGYPLFVPTSMLPVYDFDDEETRLAKEAFLQFRQQLDSEGVSHFVTETYVMPLLQNASNTRGEYVRNTIASDINQRILTEILPMIEQNDPERYAQVQAIINYRPSRKGSWGKYGAEENLLMLSASGLLTNSELTQLETLLGKQFRQDQKWQTFSAVFNRNNRGFSSLASMTDSFQGLSQEVTNVGILPDSLADTYRQANGATLPIPTSRFQFIDETTTGLLELLNENRSTLGDESFYRARSQVGQALVDAQNAKTISDHENILRSLYGLIEETFPSQNESSVLRATLKNQIDATSFNMQDISPTSIEILNDRPALHAMEQFASHIISEWALTSNGDDPLAHAIQDSAQDIFDLDPDLTVSRRDMSQISQRIANPETFDIEVKKQLDAKGELIKLFLVSEYNNTQQFFYSMDFNSMPAVRGMFVGAKDPFYSGLTEEYALVGKNAPPPFFEVVAPLRPLSSFSTYGRSMEAFAPDAEGNIVITTQVPIHQIIATPFTGRGCLNEFEIIVLGKPLNARVYRANDFRRNGGFNSPTNILS